MSRSFSPVKDLPLYGQVTRWLEQRITCGDLQPGERLPSTDGLATELNVGRKVIQQALAQLSDRGLLERAPGRGTFVSRSIQSNQIAVIFQTNLLVGEIFSFYRLVCNEVLKIARAKGFKVALFFPTDEEDMTGCLDEIRQQVAYGRIRGVISFGWGNLDDIPVPCISGSNGAASRPLPRESMVFRGLAYLISRTYQRIAILEHNIGEAPYPRTRQAVEQILTDHASQPQITFHQGINGHPNRNGRTVMNEILSNPDARPQALLSLDDNLTRGAIISILEHGLRIPQDIAVLSHANKGSTILSPVPLTLLEYDPGEFAQCTIEALQARLDGRAPIPLANHPRLVVGKSCGEQAG